jgi:hypothetical protein
MRNPTVTLPHLSEMIIQELRQELTKYTGKEYRVNAQQFSKEKLKNPWVLKTPIMRKAVH